MTTEKATYSHGHHASVVKSHARRTVQDSAAFLLPHIQKNHNILDVGCGPGSITLGLAKAAPEGKVIGCDFVAEVIAQANDLAKAQNQSNLTFETIDANQLPYEDGSFDIVYCSQVLQHVADPVGILKEMKRVAKPGGFVAAREVDYKTFAWWPEDPGLDNWKELYLKVNRKNGAEPDAGRYLPSWARKAGFAADGVTLTWGAWNYQGEDAQAFGSSWVDRALHSGYASSAKQYGFASDEDLQVVSDAWKKWIQNEHCFVIIPSGEILCRV